MEMQTWSEKEKKLKHVLVYNQLYQQIQKGIYPPGSQLPSEPELARSLQVSRMTLRRALALLQEDHVVKNIRGKGNFICENPAQTSLTYINQFCHPVRCCCLRPLDEPRLEFRIEPPTESITQVLGKKYAAVVITDRWYPSAGQVCAYSLSFLPIETISQMNIDLNQPEMLLSYLETDIYRTAAGSCCTFSHTTTGNFTAMDYVLSRDGHFILIQENIYDRDQRILVFSKHYLPVSLFEMRVQTKKE